MQQVFKKYPIYKFSAVVRDHVDGSTNPEQTMSGERMFPAEPTESELLEHLRKYGDAIINKRSSWTIDFGEGMEPRFVEMTPAEAKLEIVTLSVSTPILESWVLGWFSHSTIDEGQDDEYFIQSFSEYVARVQIFNREHGEMVAFKDGTGHYWTEPICLMGAEDRWRWHSLVYPDDFNPKDRDEYKRIGRDRDHLPCRCRFCKEQGIVQINH